MSDKVIVTKSKLTAIADEIRSKLESADTYTLDDMPDAIESIEGGGIPERELLFDLRVDNGVLKDIVGNTPLRTNAITISNDTFSGSSGSAYIRTDFCFNPCEKYEIKIKCADYSDLEYTSLADLAILLSFGANNNSHIGIRSHKENGYWYFSKGSTSSNDILITDNFYFFSDTEVTIKVEEQESPYLHQVLKLNNVNSGGDMMYSNGYLQVYSSSYSWIANQIPIEYIQIYKINNLPEAAV